MVKQKRIVLVSVVFLLIILFTLVSIFLLTRSTERIRLANDFSIKPEIVSVLGENYANEMRSYISYVVRWFNSINTNRRIEPNMGFTYNIDRIAATNTRASEHLNRSFSGTTHGSGEEQAGRYAIREIADLNLRILRVKENLHAQTNDYLFALGFDWLTSPNFDPNRRGLNYAYIDDVLWDRLRESIEQVIETFVD